jgi:hypothetical protein
MLAVGYRFVRHASDFDTALKVTVLAALVPASVGLLEWLSVLLRGDFGPFEALYARRGLDDAQRFVVFSTGDGHVRIPRVPSTFTAVSQYYSFTLAAFSAALALALSRRTPAWTCCALLFAAAALTSGARAAYVMVPALLVVTLALRGRWPRPAVAAPLALPLAALIIVAPQIPSIAFEVPSHIAVTLRTSIQEAVSNISLFGNGTGWDTNAALRYGGVTERRYVENWYAKAMLELGVVGLAALVVAVAGLIVRLARPIPLLAPAMRERAAPLVALLGLLALSMIKGPYIDLDPVNVYFWLFAGMLFGLFRAGGVERGAQSASTADGRDEEAESFA